MGMPWIKLYTDLVDDPRLARLSEADRWRYVQLALAAGVCDAEGYLVHGPDPLSAEDLAWRLRLPPAELQATLERLLAAGFLALDDGAYHLPGFAEAQGRPQSARRAAWRARKQRQRDRLKADPPGDAPQPDPPGDDGPAPSPGTGSGTVAQVPQDARGTPAPRSEKEAEQTQISGASGTGPPPSGRGPACPDTFAAWFTLIQHSGNRHAVLRRMFEHLYPGRDPPGFGEIGRAAREVGGAGRLAELLWQHATRPPSGNVLAYVVRAHARPPRTRRGGGPRADRADATIDIQGHVPRDATAEELYGPGG